MGIFFKGARLLVAVLMVVLLTALGLLAYWATHTGVAGMEYAHGTEWGWLSVLLAERGIELPLIYGRYRYAADVWQWGWPAAVLFAAPGLLLALPMLVLGGAWVGWAWLRAPARRGGKPS